MRKINTTCILIILIELFAHLKLHAQTVWQDIGGGTDSAVTAMVTYNGNLYVAGSTITKAGTVSVNRIAKWNGTTWSSVGTGITGTGASINSMAVYNNELYVSGAFTTAGGVTVSNIAKWNGTTWSAVGSGISGLSFLGIRAMTVYNNELYVGGTFTTAGGATVNNIAKWNGTSWSQTGSGVISGPFLGIMSMTVYNNELIVAGGISFAGGVNVSNIAKWNGTTWSALGSGISGGFVTSVATHAGELYVYGGFTTAGAVSVTNIAKWNGSSWSAVGDGINSGGSNSTMYSTPIGLYLGGSFTGSGTLSATNIIRWNGSVWENLGNGLNSNVTSMADYGSMLIISGAFTALSASPNTTFSRLVGIRMVMKAPTVNASNAGCSNINQTSMTVSWLNGNGKKRLVLAKAGNAVDSVPQIAKSYTANSNFGSGNVIGTGNYAVHAGSGNSVTVTNLSPDNVYQYAVFEYNDTTYTDAENYLTTGFATTIHTTIALEPTISGTKFTFSSASATTMTVDITAGNGSKRIVIAKQGSAVNKIPVDTFEYAANSIFGTAGTDLGSGNFVVYNGAANSFSLSGLTANTLYYFASYEYNGSTPAANNYLLANAAFGYQSTLTTEPTKSDTLILFTNVKDSSMTLSWTVGNGQRRLVLAATSAIASIPIDGSDPITNDTFGKGADLGFGNYVVYNGTSNTCNIKGLAPNTTYHFAIFEYNGTNTSNNYLLINPATASKSTLIAEPTISATNVTLSPITNGITTVNWTNGNGDNRIVVARQSAPINILPEDGKSYTANAIFGSGNDLGQGNFVCYIGSNNTFNLQGLDPNNLYYIGVIEYNGSGGGSNYKLNLFPIADNLPAEPTTMSTNMTFSDITNSSVKVSWTKGNGAYRVLIAKDGAAANKKPIDGTVYVANSSFGTGADLGLANFVVYNGVGNTATITNLSDQSTYHFALFEFNKDASGPANYANTSLNASVEIGSSQGLEDAANMQLQFQLYPNPSSGNFTFENKSIENCEVKVFDMKGRLVDSFSSLANSNQYFDYSMLQSGLYLIQVKSDTGINNLKLIIEK